MTIEAIETSALVGSPTGVTPLREGTGLENKMGQVEDTRQSAEKNLALSKRYEEEAAKIKDSMDTLYPDDPARLQPIERHRFGFDSEDPQIKADGLALYTQGLTNLTRHYLNQRGLARLHSELADELLKLAQRKEV